MTALQYLLESPLRWTLSGTRQVFASIKNSYAVRRDADERRHGLNG
ncbi:hypothetical protein PDO_2093 [Rhizobium sp. PDO1-076]|nr:hypothetical protein [Rhizobium sp. PDO1-076]EHS51076.1 hypothetical protein PDO_2093 [Rhizobium sp. PDO1-076]